MGKDIIEQLLGGSVTLLFKTDCGTWDAETLTYTCGNNSVTVSGVSEVNLKFGNSDITGAFDEVVTKKIFEDKNKALLA